jgi:plastocyanin
VVVVTALDPGPQVTAPNAGADDRDERSTRHRGPAWRWPAAALAVAVAVGTAGLGVARLAGGDPPPPAMGPGDVTVEIDVEHSLYAITELRVVEGTRVRFVVVNGDPIAHELIVGPPDVHARHAAGTEAEHPSIPGEVSVGARLTAVATFTFDEPGTFEFACHLPGHYEYGMHGEVEVVRA